MKSLEKIFKWYFENSKWLTVRRNIIWLQKRINDVDLEGHVGQQLRSFYEKKLDVQKLAIKWLTQHINH